ncbi:hypothetical protein [Candidatus Cetobacterium colombiensis]|uniref:Uncharacterized protein n=1 Tax=Candidatus Cetobacterium colombiensis TaxID=3073100 RepID=A0ABU4WC75_9FUSO|nr:hypothetical protein [Candidatus Cetobacterium colombiensis]MDX8337138.1 hypothetical protein [Candidatus Cetobacterium colombiensis]
MDELNEYLTKNCEYMLDNLNFYLKKLLHKNIQKDKKLLKISLSEKEEKFFYEEIYKNSYTLEQEERTEFILMAFLFIKGVKLSDIEKKLEITRATLKKYVDEDLSYELVHITEYFISGGVKENIDELKESIEKYIHELILLLEEKLDISLKERYLPEKLTENEIFHIAKEIKSEIEAEKNRVISLKKLLWIVERNSEKLDRKKIVEELLLEFGKVIKKDI